MRFITVAFVVALIVALAIPAAIVIRLITGGGLGDPWYSLWVRNDSDKALFVQYIYDSSDATEPGQGTGFKVPAHRSGATYQSGQPWVGRVRVLSLDCMVLWEQQRVASQSGGLVIAADRAVRWSEDRSELPDPVYPSAGRPPADSGIRPEGECRPYGPIEWDSSPYTGS